MSRLNLDFRQTDRRAEVLDSGRTRELYSKTENGRWVTKMQVRDETRNIGDSPFVPSKLKILTP